MEDAYTLQVKLLESIIQRIATPLFVIDRDHKVLYWNNALAQLTGKSSFEMVGTKSQWSAFYDSKREVMADLVVDNDLDRLNLLYSKVSSSLFTSNAYQAEGWFENLNGKRRYIFFEAVPVLGSNSEIVAAVEIIEDITDRKLIEESLQDHNSLLQNILDAIPNPVYYKNPRKEYLGCNKAFQKFFGYPQQMVIGKRLEELMDIAHAKLSISYDNTVIESRQTVFYETTLLNHAREKRRVLAQKAPYFTHDGTFAGIVGTFADVTEQIRMSDRLSRLSMAVEQSSSSIIMTNRMGDIEYVNRKFCETTGYSEKEAIGANPRILKSGELPAEAYKQLWARISSGNTWSGELHNRRKDGSLFWEVASISPLKNSSGAITGYLAVKDDITDRKEKELQLAELFIKVENAKKEWEQSLDHLKDFIILTDEEQRIRRCNRILPDLCKKNMDELIGSDWREVLEAGAFVFKNFVGNHGDIFYPPRARSYDLTIYPMDASGTNSGYVISLNDTSELKEAAAELEKAYSKLKEAQLQLFQQEKLASVGQLAAGVAHEINNPMGFISSNLGTLDKYVNRLAEYIGNCDEAIAGIGNDESIKKIQEAKKRLKIDIVLDDSHQLVSESLDGAGRVRRIVQDLKSFSRIDQAEVALIDLNEALETTINIAWSEIKYVAELKREFGDIPKVRCFPQQLNQVFLNLLVNAAHAMGGVHGTITVRTRLAGDRVCVEVSDTGCGIPEEIRRKIFEPFFTTKEVGKGTGLGLSISYDIIKKHQGEISVESEQGIGTTFIVSLPIEAKLDILTQES